LIDIKQNFGKEKIMFRIKKSLILEHTSVDIALPNVEPMRKNIPDWYKRKNKFFDNNNSKIITSLPVELTFKACATYSDSFTVGYSVPLAVDIAVKQTEGGPSVTWADPGLGLLESRNGVVNSGLPTPLGCHEQQFAWRSQNIIKIPKGYSALMTHPLNRFDLPFITLSGFVDGEYVLQDGNVPVYFSNTFEGIIPAGTPILQVILFKREEWDSKVNPDLLEQARVNKRKSLNTAYGWYKRSHWQKKIYN
jgi:hypothetical protein